MNPQGKFITAYLSTIKFISPEWKKFVQSQRKTIMERLERCNHVSTAKDKLDETGDLTPYQHHKTAIVIPFLNEVLEGI